MMQRKHATQEQTLVAAFLNEGAHIIGLAAEVAVISIALAALLITIVNLGT